MKKINKLLTAFICMLLATAGTAQSVKHADDKAVTILNKAIGEVFGSENVGIYFEGISYGIKNPEDIFTLPVYKVFRGGYLFSNKNKFKMELGQMKSVSDGKLMVVVDEESKTMIVDSVRNNQSGYSKEDVSALINEDFKESTLDYKGIVVLNNHKCHKIISSVKGEQTATEIIYWVDVESGNLYLMSEKQNNVCNAYWFKKVGKAPENYKYDVYLPKKELSTFHGYTVVDNRFSQID